MGRRKHIPELTEESQNSFCKIDSSDSFIWGKVLAERVTQKHWVESRAVKPREQDNLSLCDPGRCGPWCNLQTGPSESPEPCSVR